MVASVICIRKQIMPKSYALDRTIDTIIMEYMSSSILPFRIRLEAIPVREFV